MAAILDYIIGKSNQELIRDRVAIILTEELANQAALQGDVNLNADIFTERYDPPDAEEERVIIVGIDRGSYESQTVIHQDADFMYYIDIYTTGKSNDNEDGYLVSSNKLQRLAGLVRSIIQAPQYVRLGFDDPQNSIIYRRMITNVVYDSTGDEEDAENFRMCRLSLKVEFNEEQPGEDTTVAVGYDTQVKIEETEKGYKYTVNN